MSLRSIWKLLGYHVSQNQLPEQDSVEAWAEEKPENRTFLNDLEKFRIASDTSRVDEETRIAWSKLKQNIDKSENTGVYTLRSNRKRIYQQFPVFKVAASITFLILLAGALTIFKHKDGQLTENTKVETINEGNTKTKVLLPDGTTVWLNAKSKLTYPKSFAGLKTREVSLEGEAFFDVTHDENAPFVVNTINFHIEVLGTAFNVRSYAEDANQVTTLVRGSIKLKVLGGTKVQEQEVLMTPNQEITYNKDVNEIKLGYVKAIEASAWIEGKYKFKQKSFREIANALERGYHVRFAFCDSATQYLTFTGTLSQDDKIDQIMKVIKLGVPITYKISGDSLVLISSK